MIIKLIHIITAELFALIVLIRAFRYRKPELIDKSRIIDGLSLVLGVLAIALGIILYYRFYNPFMPLWLNVKLVLVILSVVTGIYGTMKKSSNALFFSFLVNLLIIIIANVKF